MHDQPKYEPLEESTSSPTAAARPLVAGTVARGQLRDDALLYTGKVGRRPTRRVPVPRRRRRCWRAARSAYNIYCSPCHGLTGAGDGMVVQRGYRRPPSFHDERLREAPVGHFFDVITNGFGAMPDYAAQIHGARPLGDRRPTSGRCSSAQHATLDDVPAEPSADERCEKRAASRT